MIATVIITSISVKPRARTLMREGKVSWRMVGYMGCRSEQAGLVSPRPSVNNE